MPSARGRTPQACGYRDGHAALAQLGATVLGLSTLDTADQQEAAERLHLPFPLLSDARLELVQALGLPTFEVAGQTLLKRLTLAIHADRVHKV